MILEPRTGELRHLCKIRQWQDVPSSPGSGITQNIDAGVDAWAKIVPVAGSVYHGSAQTDHAVTHRFEVRYITGITAEHVIDCEGQRYRVKRVSHMNGGQRFTALEVEELGPAT